MSAQVLIWASGHSPAQLDGKPADQQFQVSRLGFAVLFAACVAGFNWGLAGWTIAASKSEDLRLAYSALAALLGTGLVLSIDRLFIYMADTVSLKPSLAQRFALALFSVLRIGIVLAVSALTSQQTLPFFLGDELDVHAIKMQEESELTRRSTLTEQNDLAGKTASAETNNKEVARLKAELITVPAEIEKLRNEARRCWINEYKPTISRVMSQDEVTKKAAVDSWQARNVARACLVPQLKGEAQWLEHQKKFAILLDAASADFTTAQANLVSATDYVDSLVVQRGAVERRALNKMSALVLQDAIRRNPGAALKWALITLMMLACELLPFLLKTFGGRTVIGYKIAADRELHRRATNARLLTLDHDEAIRQAASATAVNAARGALQSPQLQHAFAAEFESMFEALAPVEAVRTMMQEFESSTLDIADFKHRYPQYANLIADAWAAAICKSSDLLARTFNTPMHLSAVSHASR